MFTKNDIKMMEVAYVWASASYAIKRKVGAVISVNGRTVATGYNGTLPRHDNNCEEPFIKCSKCGTLEPLGTIDGSIYSTCKSCNHKENYILTEDNIVLKTNEFVLHAEQNALMDAARHGKAIDGGTIYITTSPCKTCAKLLAAGGIKEVIYAEVYRDTEGIDYLKREGINVRQLKKDELWDT